MASFSNEDTERINKEIEAALDAELAKLTPEQRAEALAAELEADIQKVAALRQMGIDAKIIPYDRHHLMIDGEIMGYAEFDIYMQTHDILQKSLQRYEQNKKNGKVNPFDDDYDDYDEEEDVEQQNQEQPKVLGINGDAINQIFDKLSEEFNIDLAIDIDVSEQASTIYVDGEPIDEIPNFILATVPPQQLYATLREWCKSNFGNGGDNK